MLLLTSQETLERRRTEDNTYGSVTTSGYSGRWPVQRGEIRYDFEEIYGKVGDREEYDFEIEFPMYVHTCFGGYEADISDLITFIQTSKRYLRPSLLNSHSPSKLLSLVPNGQSQQQTRSQQTVMMS
jgi:hypothetical protein